LAASAGIHRDGHCIAPPDPGRPPAWRLRVPDGVVAFDDALQGLQQQNVREVAGDFVIRRVEGYYAYQLACVVDDAFQEITEVVRGTDLLDSTARQIALQQCLGLPTPAYRHLPLALDDHGRKLSKSERARPVDPSDPLPALRRALAFLDVQTSATATSPSALLDAALQRFDPACLPRVTARTV
jgi:glutamyl-Q tRNA(Asp) synthetase